MAKRVVAEAVHVVGPEREHVVGAPAAPRCLCRREVLVVKPFADRGQAGCGQRRGGRVMQDRVVVFTVSVVFVVFEIGVYLI